MASLPGYPLFSKPRVSVSALGVEAAGGPGRDIEKPSDVGVTIAVDVCPYIDEPSGLFVSKTQTEVSGDLLGVQKVSKATGGDYESRGECYSYTLDGCEECELLAGLVPDKLRKFHMKPCKPLVDAYERLADRMDCALVRDGQTSVESLRLDKAVLYLLSCKMVSLRILNGVGLIFSP